MDTDKSGFIDLNELINLLPAVLADGQKVSDAERKAAVSGAEGCFGAGALCSDMTIALGPSLAESTSACFDSAG